MITIITAIEPSFVKSYRKVKKVIGQVKAQAISSASVIMLARQCSGSIGLKSFVIIGWALPEARTKGLRCFAEAYVINFNLLPLWVKRKEDATEQATESIELNYQ